MADRRPWVLLGALFLPDLIAWDLRAEPAQISLLSPALALSGRISDPEHMVNPYEVAVVPSAKEEFVSADPDVADGETLAPGRGATGSGGFSGVGDDAFAFLAPGEAELAIHDYEDTLIRTEQSTLERTFVGEGGERLPDSWVVPPGGGVPGGYPGYRREATLLDYSGSPGVSYFPPPSIDSSYRGGSYRGGSHSYPYSGTYHPGGPYAYRYDGMVPLGDPPERGQWDFDSGLGLLDRSFDPYRADFKAGPVYFEALYLESGLLYSDYHGPEIFAPGEEDGWLSFVSLRLQMGAQIGPSLYLLADGEIIYLPGINRVGYRSGLDLGGGPFARIGYETEIAGWQFRAYAEFGTGSFDAVFGDSRTAYERAGNYSFGISGRYDEDMFYAPYLYTTIGATAVKQVQPDWRVRLIAEHSDYWYVGDDLDADQGHDSMDHFGFRYESLPGEVLFSPYFSYDAYSYDQFDSVYNTAYIGGSGRLSPNVFADARIGYLWSGGDEDGYESPLWEVGLRHQINSRTWQEVRFGESYEVSDFSSDSVVTRYLRYSLSRRVSDRVRLEGFAQWSENDYLSGRFAGDGLYQSEMYGGRAYVQVDGRTSLDFGYLVEHSSNQDGGRDYDRGLFDARLETRITDRSTVYLYYQHDDTDLYYEDLYMLGFRRDL